MLIAPTLPLAGYFQVSTKTVASQLFSATIVTRIHPVMIMHPDHLVTVASGLISQQVAGETLIFDIEGERSFTLDGIGGRVWELLQEHGRLEPVVKTLLGEFDVSRDQLEMDLQSLLEQLLDAGLISLKTV